MTEVFNAYLALIIFMVTTPMIVAILGAVLGGR